MTFKDYLIRSFNESDLVQCIVEILKNNYVLDEPWERMNLDIPNEEDKKRKLSQIRRDFKERVNLEKIITKKQMAEIIRKAKDENIILKYNIFKILDMNKNEIFKNYYTALKEEKKLKLINNFNFTVFKNNYFKKIINSDRSQNYYNDLKDLDGLVDDIFSNQQTEDINNSINKNRWLIYLQCVEEEKIRDTIKERFWLKNLEISIDIQGYYRHEIVENFESCNVDNDNKNLFWNNIKCNLDTMENKLTDFNWNLDKFKEIIDQEDKNKNKFDIKNMNKDNENPNKKDQIIDLEEKDDNKSVNF